MPTRKRIKHGISPFPEHVAPSPDDCQRVWELLTAAHGPEDSSSSSSGSDSSPLTTAAGCGDPDDVLNALCRTIISGASHVARADAAIQNLAAEFGSGGGGGDTAVNWLAVADAPSERVHAAIKGCGLGNKKTEFVKALCARVRAENTARLAALRADKSAGMPSPPPSPLDGRLKLPLPYSDEDRDAEIAELSVNILSLQRLRRPEVTVSDALRQLSAFQGVSVKTAACVVLSCLHKPCLAVDGNVWRLARWLGWVPERATDLHTFYHLEVRAPDGLKRDLRRLLALHGGQACFRCASAANRERGAARWEACVCPLEDLLDRGRGDAVPAKGKADAGAVSPAASTYSAAAASPAAATSPAASASPASTTMPDIATFPETVQLPTAKIAAPSPANHAVPPAVNLAVPSYISSNLGAGAHALLAPEYLNTFAPTLQISTNLVSGMNKPKSEPIFNVLPPSTPSVPMQKGLASKQEEVEEKKNEEKSTQDVTMMDIFQSSDPTPDCLPANNANIVVAHSPPSPWTEESGAEWRYIVDKAMPSYRRADLEASLQMLPTFRQLDEMMLEDRKADLEAIDDFYDAGDDMIMEENCVV
ncbi:hypothetical protein GGTG_11665 [Gaeumannomyces tritici R3-111a-1]|uniref:HhH-GPD domain-containing protein n=1 Tax=Gaeumannomyces tritici (strain R3-111a-1) TaxID=644352 RepID=J3PDU2_GAET3|nr:hypothetical protein GGTG_11665 [Gaeumannomyces tritici R3-111a-1]EJT70642.1 hypothetical protein GGTG_11665 [Gaeumannomyces tritici R3-111a-1]